MHMKYMAERMSQNVTMIWLTGRLSFDLAMLLDVARLRLENTKELQIYFPAPLKTQ